MIWNEQAKYPNGKVVVGSILLGAAILGGAYFIAEAVEGWFAGTSPQIAAGVTAGTGITAGTNGEMLKQAIQRVQMFAGTAVQKADLFENLGQQITKLSGGYWSATRSVGADGSQIFWGTLGEALVVSPAGQLFRGNITTGFTFGPGGILQPIYKVLREIAGVQ